MRQPSATKFFTRPTQIQLDSFFPTSGTLWGSKLSRGLWSTVRSRGSISGWVGLGWLGWLAECARLGLLNYSIQCNGVSAVTSIMIAHL